MGVTFFVATAGLVVAGYFGYRKLQKIEEEIREEIETREEPAQSDAEKAKVVEVKPKKPPAKKAPADTLEAQVLEAVRREPGKLQTAIYDEFAGTDRKKIQELLLRMDREGKLRREKKGSTYKIFPA